MAKKTVMQKAAGVAEKVVGAVDDVVSGWAKLRKDLDAGDMGAVRNFLVQRDIPVGLAAVLDLVRPMAKEMEEEIKARDAAEKPGDLEDRLRILARMHPRSVDEVGLQKIALDDARKRHAKAEAAQNKLAYITQYQRAINATFRELLTGQASIPLIRAGATILPPIFSNAMVAAGFDPGFLSRGVWTEVYQRAPARQNRKRLVASGGQNR